MSLNSKSFDDLTKGFEAFFEDLNKEIDNMISELSVEEQIKCKSMRTKLKGMSHEEIATFRDKFIQDNKPKK